MIIFIIKYVNYMKNINIQLNIFFLLLFYKDIIILMISIKKTITDDFQYVSKK